MKRVAGNYLRRAGGAYSAKLFRRFSYRAHARCVSFVYSDPRLLAT
jgi:hypothetical protein